MTGKRRHTESVAGVLNIGKPAGWTSHDVVARLRRITGVRRVGHAGTLDPMATGVLVVCVGRATRVVEYLAEETKDYRATIRFGQITDTWDAEGQVVAERDASGLTRDAVEGALESFRGTIQQVPPMYSALKRAGRPLYRLAREGITVERPPRQVTIHHLQLAEWHPAEQDGTPVAVLEVRCSKGTYIRSLAHDLGQALGPGGHLTGLVRTAVGSLTVRDAVSLDRLAEGDWREHLLPLKQALAHMPDVTLNDDQVRRVVCGQALDIAELDAVADKPQGAEICAYDGVDRLIAVLRRDRNYWRPHKVLADSI